MAAQYEFPGTARRWQDRRSPYRSWVAILAVLLAPAIAAAVSPPEPLAGSFLAGDDTPAAALGNQDEPAIARGGDQYLVVWTDNRTSYDDASGQSGSKRDIYAARLDADGNVIDTTPIVVTGAPGDQYDPHVVWNGNKWLVVWTDSQPSNAYYHPIKAARVSAGGQVLDSTPLTLWAPDYTSEHLFGVASDGQNWAVGITDEYYNGLATNVRLVARRVMDNGSVGAVSGVFSPSSGVFFGSEALAWTGTQYLALVYGYVDSTYFGIMGIRLTSTLSVIDSYPFPITQTTWANNDYYLNPGFGTNGDELFVVWEFQHNAGTSQIYGARVDGDGNSLDGDGYPVASGLPSTFDTVPRVAWDGSQWIVAWPQDGAFTMARISALGGVTSPVVPVPGASDGAIVAATGGGTRYVWPEDRVGGTLPLDLFTARLDGVLVPGPDHPVALGAPFQTEAALAVAPDGYLLVYRSDTSGDTRIMARALTVDGSPVATDAVVLASGDVDDPRAAYSEGKYLVAWNAAGEVQARRLMADGTPIDAEPVMVLAGHDADVAGYSGGDPGGIFLVTAASGSGAASRTIAARVAGDGTLLDATPFVLAGDHAFFPRAIQHGVNWLAVWESTGHGNGGEIDGALIATGGGYAPFHFTSDTDGLAAHRPALAGNDTTLVMWHDPRGNGDIYGRRLLPSLDSFDAAGGIALLSGAGTQDQGEIGWDGSSYLIVARDDRGASPYDPRTDVYRNFVQPLALIANPAGTPLFTTDVDERDPAVAGGAGYTGGAVYVASVFDPAAPYAALRLLVSPTVSPTPVAENDTPRPARLLSVFPNPANPAVEIRFRSAAPGDVAIDVFDVRGRRVRTLHALAPSTGEGQVRWDGTDDSGRSLASGTYLLRMQSAGGRAGMGRVVIVR